MDSTKSYNDPCPDKSQVREPSLEYARLAKAEEPVKALPRDVVIDAAEYAVKMRTEGRCIPNVQVAELLNSRFGWR